MHPHVVEALELIRGTIAILLHLDFSSPTLFHSMAKGLFLVAVIAAILSMAAFWTLSSAPLSVADEALRAARNFLAQNAGLLVPLRQDLGKAHWAVCTRNPLAQRYFDQGLRWIVAYNFKLALISFMQSETLDPHCAMCAWGEAASRGQNLNEFMDLGKDNIGRAYRAMQRAIELNQRFEPLKNDSVESNRKNVEHEFLKAASLRFAQLPKDMEFPKRQALNEAYADSMAHLAEDVFPENIWILFFAASSQMNTSPWNYFVEMLPGGQGKTLREPRISKAVKYVNHILTLDPMHAGALHLKIHLFESASDPTPALDAAKKLDGLIPGSEHLLHMPSHAYIRTGMLADANRVNHAAQTVPLQEHAYPEHNVEFIVYASIAMRDSNQAQTAAWKLFEISESLLASGKDGYEAIFPYERFVVAPLYTCVVFRNLTCLSLYPEPSKKRVLSRAFYHWAHGIVAEDEKEMQSRLQLLEEAIEELKMPVNMKRYTATLYPVINIVTVLRLWLESSLRPSQSDALQEAASIQWYYDEPPSMFFSPLVVLACAEQNHTMLHEALAYHIGNQWAMDCLADDDAVVPII